QKWNLHAQLSRTVHSQAMLGGIEPRQHGCMRRQCDRRGRIGSIKTHTMLCKMIEGFCQALTVSVAPQMVSSGSVESDENNVWARGTPIPPSHSRNAK